MNVPDISVTGLHLSHSVYKDNDIPIYVVLLFCYFENNSGCIHSIDGDMRYKAYL